MLLPALAALACTMPEQVQVKGNVDVRMGTSMSFGNMFSDFVGGAFDGAGDTVNCVNEDGVSTVLVYMEIGKIDVAEAFGNIGFKPGESFTPGSNAELGKGEIEPISFKDMLDESLGGFDFKGIKSKLYVSGGGIAKMLAFTVTANGTPILNGDGVDINDQLDLSSMRDRWADLKELPSPGKDVNIENYINGRQDINASFTLNAKAGTEIPANLITGTMKIELAIWIPLDLVATKDTALNFPDNFMGDGGDLFGRDEKGEGGFGIKSLTLEVGIPQDPFSGTLMIKSGSIEIPSRRIDGGGIGFDIDDALMAKINTELPFAPRFSIDFHNTDTLRIPATLNASFVRFKAEIDHTIKL
jgi:hypothetical protein